MLTEVLKGVQSPMGYPMISLELARLTTQIRRLSLNSQYVPQIPNLQPLQQWGKLHLPPPSGLRTCRPSMRQIPLCLKPILGPPQKEPKVLYNIFLVVIINVTSSVWSYYVIYATIYVLSPVARTVMASDAGWIAFYTLCRFWATTACITNLTAWAKVAGPIRTRYSPGSDNLPQRRTTPRPQRRATARIVRGFAEAIFVTVVVLVFLVFTSWPGWWVWPAGVVMQRKAWANEHCREWDYEITFNTVRHDQLGEADAFGYTIFSNATLLSPNRSSLLMEVKHPPSNVSLITVSSNNTDFDFVVQYNFTELSYTESKDNVSGVFNWLPIPGFLNISLSSLYPDYGWDYYCTAPRVVLMDANETEILRTSISNGCTELKVCGMGPIERLAIPLGVVFIEMEKAGLCCTNPFGCEPP